MIVKTDEEIAAQVQNGDVESFGLLVERYEQRLTRYARKFLLDNEDSKDLVQEVFIKAYVNIQSFDPKRKFSPWIYRIAHNEFVNAGKKRWREKIFQFDLDLLFPHPAAKEATDEQISKQDLKQMLDRCLKKLNRKYREPLVLYYYEDMDYGQIAEILKIPISTVGVRLQRGKALLGKLVIQLDSIYG